MGRNATTLPRRAAAFLALIGLVSSPSRSQTPSEVLERAQRGEVTKAAQRRPTKKPAGKWLGQDGHDLVGHSPTPAPNDVQDIHIAIFGLPAERTIVWAKVDALGGSEWHYNGPPGSWRAEIVREAASPLADVYIEPGQAETGRPFAIELRFDDGSTLKIPFAGGKADPNRRMPQASLQARWIGQDGRDVTGPGPSVGPDGMQDAHVALTNLSPKTEIKEVAVDAPGLPGWRMGVNPQSRDNAELLRKPDDPTKADLFFQPESDLNGQTVTVLVIYANGKTDRTKMKAGLVNPRLKMPAGPPLPNFIAHEIKATWIGQTGESVAGHGDVRVLLENLPQGSRVAAAALSNSLKREWCFRGEGQVAFEPEPYSAVLAVRPSADPSKLDLFFLPERDESGSPMLLRLVFADGKNALVNIPGGKCDPGRRVKGEPLDTKVTARPGDDLHALADRFGTVRLARGEHRVGKPLVLGKPVKILGEPGATLLFAQKPDDPTWSSAIKIHCGHTTLEGFAVRFAGPIRWSEGINYGPAVISTTDNLDRGQYDHKPDVTIRKLDLQGPPASGPGPWELPVNLMRLIGIPCGRVEGNILKGGTIEFFEGPWHIADNEFRGTLPGTASQAVFAGHNTHDLTLKGNTTRDVGPSGKTWRFLVLTWSGYRDVIEGNRIQDVGPRDNDTIPSGNAAEIILTEAYGLKFEGIPSSVSADGRVLRIPKPQGESARTGDGLAILSGAAAGQWRRIAQAVDSTTYLVDPPLPPGRYPISIASGFVGETFLGNWIDARGGSVAAPMILVGSHYGSKVLDNHLLGGGDAWKLAASPSEGPCYWGWSHTPFVGALVAGNTVEDSLRGGTLVVEHGPAIKTCRGRTYFSAVFENNKAVWTEDFQRRHPAPAGQRVGYTIGDAEKPNDDLLVTERGTTAVGGTAIKVHKGKAADEVRIAPPSTTRSPRSEGRPKQRLR